ncbi:MAG: DUF29 domain-containing protein [Crocosphaera sp.]|jgi:hypothetical protein
MKIQPKQGINKLYEEDFIFWIDETIKQLEKREIENLDWEHLIEEIEALGREQKNKVESYLKQLLKHLLLYQYWQSERDFCGNGWKEEIRNFRDELELRLQSKTLYNYLLGRFETIYNKARKMAIDKTGLSPETFPQACPYSFEQVLDPNFLPR